MRAVLGIDAAWSDRHPSGVALIVEHTASWECVALAPSYSEFLTLEKNKTIDWKARRTGVRAEPAALLRAAHRILGGECVTLVALDIPMATVSFSGRRRADNLLSAEYGHRGCSTHSPSRPELYKVSRRVRDGFKNAGFSLTTAYSRQTSAKVLIEVYPHPSLLTLLDEDYRVRYKVGRARSYWPECSPTQRKANLLGQFRVILNALRHQIRGIPLTMPESSDALRTIDLKTYEDSLDALVCAWVGMKFLIGEARSFGDQTAAIWVAT